jgi:very-short-patch-repair endonuclease
MKNKLRFRVIGYSKSKDDIVELKKFTSRIKAEKGIAKFLKNKNLSDLKILSVKEKIPKIQLDNIISFNDDKLLNVHFKIKNDKYEFYFRGRKFKKRQTVIRGIEFKDIKNLQIDNDKNKRFLLLNNLYLEEWILSSRFYSSKITDSEKIIIDILDKLKIKYMTHPVLALNKTKFIIPDFLLMSKELVILEIDDSSHLDKKEKDKNRDEMLKNIGFKVLRIKNKDTRVYGEEKMKSILNSNTC